MAKQTVYLKPFQKKTMKVLLVSIIILSLFVVTPAYSQGGIRIVQVESNPAGTDAGNEWIVLFNTHNTLVDLSSWIIRSTHGSTNTYTLSGTIAACSERQITFPGQFLDNEDETVMLIDSFGNVVDLTPPITDRDNDSTTWSIPRPACQPSAPLTTPESGDLLTVVFVDLGTKGESILVIFPNDNVMLIDGGMPSAYPNVESVLIQEGVTEIDVMVGTHPDQDHIAGLTAVLNDPDFDVREVLVSHVTSPTLTYQNFMNAISSNGLTAQTVFDGHTINLDPSVDVTVISPPTSEVPDGTNASEANSNSLIIHMMYEGVSFLFTADATHTTESWIASNHSPLNINIMNGPHHGSRYSSTQNFISHVDPELVVFSANQNNQYGHPHQDAIDRYSNHPENVSLLQTGLVGDVIIRTDGLRCSLFLEGQPEQPCYAGVVVVPEFGTMAILVFSGGLIGTIIFLRTKKQ